MALVRAVIVLGQKLCLWPISPCLERPAAPAGGQQVKQRVRTALGDFLRLQRGVCFLGGRGTASDPLCLWIAFLSAAEYSAHQNN